MTAFLPISVDSKAFSTASYIVMVQKLLPLYRHFVFFVADRVQVYNLASPKDTTVKRVLRSWKQKQYRDQRFNWLYRIQRKLGILECSTVVSVDEITDLLFGVIFRNTLVAAQIDKDFRNDVEAANRINRNFSLDNDLFDRKCTLTRLSNLYILEEISLSIRIKLANGILDEYYPFGHLTPMVRIFQGGYSFNAFDLAELPMGAEGFRFFEWENSLMNWSEVVIKH